MERNFKFKVESLAKTLEELSRYLYTGGYLANEMAHYLHLMVEAEPTQEVYAEYMRLAERFAQIQRAIIEQWQSRELNEKDLN